MRFSELETNIIRTNITWSCKLLRKIIGKKHSLKSISDKKYYIKKYEKQN